MKMKVMKWAFGLAWRLDKKLLVSCCVIQSAVSVLPAVALVYRQDILSALSVFVETGEGSMGDVFPAIALFGIVTVLVGVSNRLNKAPSRISFAVPALFWGNLQACFPFSWWRFPCRNGCLP